MSYEELSKKRIVTPKVRVSFPALVKPRKNEVSGKEYYEFDAVIPKTELSKDSETGKQWMAIFEHAKAVGVAKFGSGYDLKPGEFFKDADKPNRNGKIPSAKISAYKGCVTLHMKTKFKPQIVDQRRNPISDDLLEQSVYAGCYARVNLNVYAYDFTGNRGVALGFGEMQKVADGEPLASRRSASDVFDEVSMGEDDPANYSSTSTPSSKTDVDAFFS